MGFSAGLASVDLLADRVSVLGKVLGWVDTRTSGRPAQNVTMTQATGRTVWQNKATPLRHFLTTETGGAAVLVVAATLALVWVNISEPSYESVWETHLSLTVADAGVSLSLREWVNSGLMTFFFFVVGLEARREFDLGELRERRQVVLPLLAGFGGMLVPVLIYLAINAGDASARGWGVAMSTDTAIALGILAVVGRKLPTRLRAFILTLTVVDDFIALIVIATFYSGSVSMPSLLLGFGLFAAVLVVRALGVRVGLVYFLLAVATWLAVLESGVDPIVVGLAAGLITYAYPAARGDLERASDLFRQFREQPTPELAASARMGVSSAISPNDRLQLLYHPWSSYVIVPLFALANAGVVINSEMLSRAITSPITLGIVIGYVVGKPVGIACFTWFLARLTRARLRPQVGWAAVAGAGAIAGVAFTVSLLIASIAFTGEQLEEAKLAILACAPLAGGVGWIIFRITAMLPRTRRARALLGSANVIVDLAVPVDPERDHIRGPHDAPVTIVEYGDFECPYCGRAEPIVRELLAEDGDVRYAWRHLPLTDVHPRAQLSAEATEAAAAQGKFWEMHDVLFRHQDALHPVDLIQYAAEIGLDANKFARDLDGRLGADRVAEDMESADLSSVSGTPTFFINGRRHYGAYDIASLTKAVETARIQAGIAVTRE
jgi:Na+/H+ antiporter NhaA